jgi:shikimate kinase
VGEQFSWVNHYANNFRMRTKRVAATGAKATDHNQLSDHAVLAARQKRLILDALGDRLIVLVGLMASGKTSLGRLLAQYLDIPFVDADHEIELAAQLTVSEIFSRHGEAHFRSGEHKVILRLLEDGPRVLATGGGAYMNAQTREAIARRGVTIWLTADLETLMRRVRRRGNRPLLQTVDPEATMRGLMDVRYPVYALADMKVPSRDGLHETTLDDLVETLEAHFTAQSSSDTSLHQESA